MPRKTTLMIAVPLVNMVPAGYISILDEISVRIKNLVIDGQLPLEHPYFECNPIQWSDTDPSNFVFECDTKSVLKSLESNGLTTEQLESLKTALQTLPVMAYKFDYDTDPRFVNRGLDMIHRGLFGSLMELAARRRTEVNQISDACRGL